METMSLDWLLSAYLLPYTGQTYKQYRSALRAWLRWCDLNDIDALRVHRSHIEAYCRWMRRDHPAATVREWVGVVLRFYRFVTEEGVLERDPGMGVRLPRSYRRSTGSFLTREQAGMFLDAAHGLGRQEYALCALLLLAGPRLSEALGLDVEDWNRADGTLRYRRKGGYEQEVRVADAVVEALAVHVGRRRGGPVFRARRGGRLRADAARNVVRLAGALVGRPDITPHSLRRTFCTLAMDAGMPEQDIMAAGGWSTRQMVDYYDMAQRGMTQRVGDAVAGLLGR
ncbi:Phage integrase family [Bifidobacterium castoris]|uniref:Phage integrase family n=2 Tax=Bifidobacterium castoris TaxID=2306972 RepID=A0A430F4H0_9BIFI|nr:Phage integrase family [Bifidobacterium castoris]